jgi:cyclase
MQKKLIIAIILLLPSVISIGQQQNETAITVEKISDNLYQLIGGRGANGGMYIGENEVLIIDSKMDKESVEGIFTAVQGFTDKPVKYLINTHSDGDHVNGNEFFPENVLIIAHENCRNEFFHPGRDGSPSRWLNERLQKFVPKFTFNDKMLLHLGNKTIELHYFGIGHTTGDIVVYFPEEKTAFIGDQVFFGRPQLIHSYKGGNSFEHVKTVEKMLENLDASFFCSGHADIKTRTDIELHLHEMKKFQQKIISLVESGKNSDEVQREFNPDEKNLVETVYNEIKEMARN